MTDRRPPIQVPPADAETTILWGELGRLASEVLPTGWTLVGGLMVQLHAFEAGEIAVRATTDIDILGDARRPADFQALVRALRDDGFELDPPTPIDPTSHRWRRGTLVLDLLAPEGLRKDPLVAGDIGTVQIPGGTQALARTETVEVVIDGHTVAVRRPALSGALLIKARAIRVHADPDAQRADLVLLLSLVEDPSDTAAHLHPAERRWLRASEALLGLEDPLLMAPFPQNRVRRARLAYRLLTAPAQR